MAIAPGATTPQKQDQRNLEVAAAKISLVVATALVALKFVAYALTASSAIFSDALESIVNVIAAAIAIFALRVSHTPPDQEHPYGHGKVEFVSAAIEGGMILLAAPVILVQAITQFFHHGVHRPEIGAALSFVSMIANTAAGLLLIRQARRGPSIALEADGRHLLADAVTSAGVLAALILVSLTGAQWIDTLAALAVAAYLAYLAIDLLRRSFGGLMDEQDALDDAKIRQILDAHVIPTAAPPRICSYHKLRHRHSGRYHWIDFHLVVPATWNVAEGHRAAALIEKEIESALGEGNATAHIEPCESPDCQRCTAKTPAPAI
jgi:cation diffusion facilitator family transporter